MAEVDPMKLPFLARVQFIKQLQSRTMTACRLVCRSWKQQIDLTGDLRLVVDDSQSGNLNFIEGIGNPFSLHFLHLNKQIAHVIAEKSLLREINCSCTCNNKFLQSQIWNRTTLTSLTCDGEFFSKSKLWQNWGSLDELNYVNKNLLPNLITLTLAADYTPAVKSAALWYLDENCWGGAARENIKKNMYFIMKMIKAPKLLTLIIMDVPCFVDSHTKDVKCLADFLSECSRTLKNLQMTGQPTATIRNFDPDTAKPQLENMKASFFDFQLLHNFFTERLDSDFDLCGYWGIFLKHQSHLRVLSLSYQGNVPHDLLQSIINSNEKTLEYFTFTCYAYRRENLAFPAEAMGFDCAMFSGCKQLFTLHLSTDEELINLEFLPDQLSNLVLECRSVKYKDLITITHFQNVKHFTLHAHLRCGLDDVDPYEMKGFLQDILYMRKLEEVCISKWNNRIEEPLSSFLENLKSVSCLTCKTHDLSQTSFISFSISSKSDINSDRIQS